MEQLDRARIHLVATAMGPEADLVASRLARGCRCFVVWIDGFVAGYAWLSVGPEWIGEIQLQITPPEGEGYIWNCVTLPEHRRKGIFRSSLVGISEVARREGFKRLWIGTIAVPAEKVMAPVGFRPALHFHWTSFAGLHMMRTSGGPDLTLANEARAALAVRPGLVIRGSHHRRH